MGHVFVISKKSACHDVIKWKHFPLTGPLCGEFIGHRLIPLIKSQWRGALMFSLIYAWINDWVNNREAGDLRRHCAHYDVTVMCWTVYSFPTALKVDRRPNNIVVKLPVKIRNDIDIAKTSWRLRELTCSCPILNRFFAYFVYINEEQQNEKLPNWRFSNWNNDMVALWKRYGGTLMKSMRVYFITYGECHDSWVHNAHMTGCFRNRI